MATSLKAVCAALGRTGQVSLCRDVLGFFEGKMPAAVKETRPRPELSLKRFIGLLRGLHFHLHIIVTGSDLLTSNDRDVIDYGVFRLRDIYSAAGFGVGVVTRELRTAANSSGHATVSSDADIEATLHDITADGDFIPVVIPANMNVSNINPDGTVNPVLGSSPRPGPCSPRNEPGARSFIVDIEGEKIGRTLAHEAGHYLGVAHPAAADNSLMTQSRSVTSGDPFNAVTINSADRATMLTHCVIRNGLTEF